MTRLSGPAVAAPQAIELSVVIPAYNEAATIESTVAAVIRFLEAQPYASELIVVDDGSVDGTAGILAQCAARWPLLRLIHHAVNEGKGGSVRRGVLAAHGKYVFFMDADLSVPVEQLAGAFTRLSEGDEPILIGSRRTAGARIERRQPRLRECLGYGFTWLAQVLISPGIVDFTCGFKGFRREDAHALFSRQQCNDWAFDAEVLYLARLTGRRVHQYPVRWSHQKNSRVRFPRDIYRTLAALVRIRLSTRHVPEPVPQMASVAVAQQGCED